MGFELFNSLQRQELRFFGLVVHSLFGDLGFILRLSIEDASHGIVGEELAIIDSDDTLNYWGDPSLLFTLPNRSIDVLLINFDFASRQPPSLVHIFLHTQKLTS